MKSLFKRFPTLVVIGLVAPILAACGTVDLNEVKSMTVTSSPFSKALHMEYIDLAFAEADESDWNDANYFGAKALQVANGMSLPGPQPVGERDIPSEVQAEISSLYKALINRLDYGRSNKPKEAARAQAMFDCWLQEQEENFQPEDIAACRTAFKTAFAALKKPAEHKMAAPAPAPAPAPEPAKISSAGPFVIYFDFNSSALDADAHLVLNKIMSHEIAKDVDGRADIAGHTDTSGSGIYNDALAEKRTVAVYNALKKRGVNAGLIRSSYGESQNAMSSGDNNKSVINRRVEVNLSR